jgi:hypothetical protein
MEMGKFHIDSCELAEYPTLDCHSRLSPSSQNPRRAPSLPRTTAHRVNAKGGAAARSLDLGLCLRSHSLASAQCPFARSNPICLVHFPIPIPIPYPFLIPLMSSHHTFVVCLICSRSICPNRVRYSNSKGNTDAELCDMPSFVSPSHPHRTSHIDTDTSPSQSQSNRDAPHIHIIFSLTALLLSISTELYLSMLRYAYPCAFFPCIRARAVALRCVALLS